MFWEQRTRLCKSTGRLAANTGLSGDEGCVLGVGNLQVGASAKTITPTCFEQWDDVDGNNRYASNVDAGVGLWL